MKFAPHKYQQKCIDKIVAESNVGLFLDMGLGKTSITLSAILELKYRRLQVEKVLIIAPKKVAESTWIQEAAKWEHTSCLKVVPVLGSLRQRETALWDHSASVYVINRENVVWLVNYYKAAWPFDMVVIDELSSFKNNQAKRFKALCMVKRYIKRVVGLTGTPAPNGLMDLWAQMFLLDGGERLGARIGQYRERYFVPELTNGYVVYKYRSKDGANQIIQDKIADICVSMKAEDYLELPECLIADVPVVLDNKAREKYTQMEEEEILTLAEGGDITATTAAVVINKLLQMCNGAVYDGDRNIVDVHDCKLESFLELVEGLNGASALVFYNYQHDLTRLTTALGKTGLRVRLLKTDQDAKDWNSGNVDILLAHPASAGYGLNLQDGGHHIIWYSLTWNLELYQQSNKRIHRQGQTQTTIVHRLIVQGSVDEDVVKALEGKGKVQDTLLAALKERITIDKTTKPI